MNSINNFISKHMKGRPIKVAGHVILLFIIIILTIEMTYNNNGVYNRYEYSNLYEWLAYFVAITGLIYLNMFKLVPHYLLKNRLTKYILYIGLCVLGVLFVIILTQNLLFDIPESNNSKSVFLNIFGNIISISLVVISTSIFSLFSGWKKYQKRVSELEKSTVNEELQQLKNQINPHFLFNTINNANIKVEKDPDTAYSIITRLEDMLRYQFADSSSNKIQLRDDIAFLSDYLELEKTRRNSFYYTIESDESVQSLEIYPLLFIPFVENAVKHSLTTKGESNIEIVFSMEKEYLYFRCENSRPIVPIRKKTGGLGLKNIKRRLELLYGDSYSLDVVESNDKYITELHIKI